LEDISIDSSAIAVDFKVSAKSEAAIRLELQRIVSTINQSGGLKVDLSVAQKGIDAQKTAIDATVKSQMKNSAEAEKELQTRIKITNLLARAQRYQEKYASGLSQSPQIEGSLNTLIGRLSSTNEVDVDYGGHKQAMLDFAKVKQGLFEVGGEADSVGAKVREFFGRNLGNMALMAGIHALQQGLRQVYTEVVSVDGALVDLQIATGGSREETGELLKDYGKLASELSVNTIEVAKAADAWLRQGESAENANLLIRDSTMLSKLGQISSAEATEALTSARKGYNISVEDTLAIVDKLTAVDMSAAASAGGIAIAMSETATSARLAGIDMDRLIGYIAAVKEVTQDGDEAVGNFFKTLTARMGNVKAGRLVDPETEESLSNVETVLRGYGIALRESNGEFRNFQSVLDETAGRWDTFGSVAQRAIAVSFGGTRQQEKFLTLMEHYNEALEYSGVSATSAGTALQKYSEAYLPSVEAAQERASNAFTAFSNAILGSGVVSGTFDAGAGILGFLTKIVEVIGPIPMLATAAAAAFGTMGKGLLSLNVNQFNGKASVSPLGINLGSLLNSSDISIVKQYNAAISSGVDGQIAMGNAMGGLSEKGKSVVSSYNGQAVGLKSVSLGAKAAAVGTQVFNAALNAGIMLLVSVAIQALVKAFDDYVHSAEIAKAKLDEMKANADAATSGFEQQKDVVTGIREEITTISSKMAEIKTKGTLTVADKAELTVLEAQNNMLKERLELEAQVEEARRKEQEKSERDLVEAQRKIISDSLLEVQATGISEKSSLKESVDYIIGILPTYAENVKKFNEFNDEFSAKAQQAVINRRIGELRGMFDALKDVKIPEIQDLVFEIGVYLGYNVEIDESEIKRIKAAYNGLSEEVQASIASAANSGVLTVDMLKALVPNGFVESLSDVKGGVASIALELVDYVTGAKGAASVTDALGNSMNLLGKMDSLKTIADNTATLTSALKEFEDDGIVSIGTLQNLSSKFGDVEGIETYIAAIARASNTNSLKSSLNDLAAAYIQQTGIMAGLDGEYKDVIIQQLKAIGVTNAEEFALKSLLVEKLNVLRSDMGSITASEANEMYNLAKAIGVSTEALKAFSEVAQLKKEIEEQEAKGIHSLGDQHKIMELNAKIQSISSGLDLEITPEIKFKTPEAKSSSSSSSSSSSEDKNLTKWKDDVAEWKHEIAMEQKTQEDYIAWLRTNYKTRLADRAKYSTEWNSIEEEIFSFDKKAVEDAAAKQKEAWDDAYASKKNDLEMDRITEAEYYDWLEKNYKTYLSDKERYAKEWQQYELELYQYNEKAQKETWDSLLAEQKHNLEMGKISEGAYYKWLTSNYKLYLSDSKKYLNEWQKYQEEYYKWQKQQIESLIGEMKSAASGMKSVFDSFISLGKGIWDIIKSINDMIQSVIDLRMKMIEDEKNKQMEAMQLQLDALKKYYDKQKELMRAQYDEEKYLEDQAAKRKDVSSLEARIRNLSTDDSAWAQKRVLELQEELVTAQKELSDFEREHAMDEAEKMYDNAYEREEKKTQDAIKAIEDFLKDDQAMRQQALKELLTGGVKVWIETLGYDLKNNGSIVTNIFGKIDTGIGFLDKFYSLFGTGLSIFTGIFDLFRNFFNIGKIGLGLLGFASGTPSAPRGLAITDEAGTELKLANPSSGKYTFLNDGDKVFSAKASEFLYRLANNPGEIVDKMILSNMPNLFAGMELQPAGMAANIQMGDIIIQGGANERTISEFRREQRAGINTMLKELKRLQ
jgi:TP901 family phage tail tape measure protein